MAALTKTEKKLIKKVEEKGRISPRELEDMSRNAVKKTEIRVAIQNLLSKGEMRVDNGLKLVRRK